MSEELIEVLDEHGNKTGEILSMREAHERELWDGLVFIWVYNNKGEVIVQRRSPNMESYPNCWDVSAGGHPSAGEAWEAGAVKEAKEELNLDVDADKLELLGEGTDVHSTEKNRMHRGYYKLYILHYDGEGDGFRAQESEVSDIKWIPAIQILAERKDPGKAKKYTGRDSQIYEKALNTIIDRVRKSS